VKNKFASNFSYCQVCTLSNLTVLNIFLLPRGAY
jgi:hypothetical protein